MVTGQFRRFTYRELKDATGNFKEELGRGGSGVVYRGVLDEGKVVAVKKLANVAGGDEEFWAEMTVIGRINHVNLVRIWGFCSQGKHRLLVYEYVENESLDRHLFDTDRTALPWRERYRIALGTARGLAYLHHECLEWVIHCTRGGNIVPLVDGRLQGNFNPRQALEMVRISLSCMEERSSRPTMDGIAQAFTVCDDEDEHPAYRS